MLNVHIEPFFSNGIALCRFIVSILAVYPNLIVPGTTCAIPGIGPMLLCSAYDRGPINDVSLHEVQKGIANNQ